MSYIGNPLTQGFDFIDKQTFTGDGTTTSFTMRDPVGREEIIEVFVAGVRQEPGVAYTTSGANLNFTGAPGLGDTIYIVNNNSPIRLNEPAPASVDTSQIKDNAVTASKIPDGSITAAKISNGAITVAKIPDGSITGAKLNANLVISSSNTVFSSNVNFANSAGVYTLPVVDFTSANVLGITSGGGFYQGNQGSVGAVASKGNIFRINTLTLTANTTIAANEGASCVGPLTVANNIILTVNGEMVVN